MLGAVRQDELIDDRPALSALGETAPDYVVGCSARWASDTSYTWAVCEPTTGEMLAEVTLDPAAAEVRTRARDGHDDALHDDDGDDAVLRIRRQQHGDRCDRRRAKRGAPHGPTAGGGAGAMLQ